MTKPDDKIWTIALAAVAFVVIAALIAIGLGV